MTGFGWWDTFRSVFDIHPLEDRLSDAFAENRVRTALLALFAVTAMTLASLGLYASSVCGDVKSDCESPWARCGLKS